MYDGGRLHDASICSTFWQLFVILMTDKQNNHDAVCDREVFVVSPGKWG